jgi:hypothetical protein
LERETKGGLRKWENGELRGDFMVGEKSGLRRKRKEKRILNEGEEDTGDKQSDL